MLYVITCGDKQLKLLNVT